MKSIEKPQHVPGNLEFCIHMQGHVHAEEKAKKVLPLFSG